MAKIHRTSPEVKAEIIKKIKEEGVSVPQVAKDYGIHHTTIYSWPGGRSAGRALLVGVRQGPEAE